MEIDCVWFPTCGSSLANEINVFIGWCGLEWIRMDRKPQILPSLDPCLGKSCPQYDVFYVLTVHPGWKLGPIGPTPNSMDRDKRNFLSKRLV